MWTVERSFGSKLRNAKPTVSPTKKALGGTLNVAAVKADWTSYDPEITKALAKYGKNSIPQYILYIPGEERPRILPEILVPSMVLKNLEINSSQ